MVGPPQVGTLGALRQPCVARRLHCEYSCNRSDTTASTHAVCCSSIGFQTVLAVSLSVCLAGWLTQPVHNDTCAVVLQIDYNHFANHWGLYANNRINQAYPQYKPVLDYWPKARQQAAQYNCSGTHWPGHIAPFGPSAHLPTYMYFSRMRAAAKHS